MRTIIIGFIFLLCSIAAMGQPPPPASPGAPIDGGVMLLLAAVAAYGYKQRRKQE